MGNKKLFVVGGSIGYANWLVGMGMIIVNDPYVADIALFTGGGDINPVYYDEPEGKNTYVSYERDVKEVQSYNFFLERGIPMIGICRGGQLFTIMGGGKLVQHTSHPYSHKVTTSAGEVLIVNSMHHQQFLLEGCKNYELLAWAERLSPFHKNGYNADYHFPADYREPEVVYFYDSKCLAIQCHPESIANYKTMDYFKELVTKYILTHEKKVEEIKKEPVVSDRRTDNL